MKTLFLVLAIVSVIVIIGIIIYKKNAGTLNGIEVTFEIALALLFFVLAYLIPPTSTEVDTEITTSQKPTIQISETSTTKEKTTTTSTTTTSTTTIAITTTTVTAATESIKNNQIIKTFRYEDQSFSYLFVAPVSGNYRFDFSTDDAQTDYEVFLFNKNNERLFHSCYSTYAHGITIDLEKGNTYTLRLSQYDGYPTAKVKINVPSEAEILDLNN